MVNIIHLSDPHVRAGDAGQLPSLLQRLAQAGPADLVVVSGDCSDDGTIASYQLLQELIGPFAQKHGASAVFAVGNHDQRSTFNTVLGHCGLPEPLADGLVTERVTGRGQVAGMQVVVLDSLVPGRAYGQLGTAQLDALGAVLDQPTVLVVHHPPIPAATDLLSTLGLADAADLAEIIASSQVRVVLSGHYHYPASALLRGVPVLVAPGIANMAQLGADRREHRTLAGCGAQLIEISDTGYLATPLLLPDGDLLDVCTAEQLPELADRIGYPTWRSR